MNLPVVRGQLPPFVLLLVAVVALAYAGYSLVEWQLSARDAGAYMAAHFWTHDGRGQPKGNVTGANLATYVNLRRALRSSPLAPPPR